MSDEQRKNLLVRNKTDHYPHYTYAGDGWIDGRGVTDDGRIWNNSSTCDFSCELAPGTYVLIAECDGPDTAFQEGLSIYKASGDTRRANFPVGGAGAIPPVRLTVTDKDAGTWYVAGKRRGARWRAALFAGTEPAAWAPYSGEDIAGVGALMSANLWDASTANFKPDADGVYICGTSTGELNCSIAGASALTENQTVHMSSSLRRAYNLLKGTGDGTWANYEGTKESATAFGTKVVSCVRNSSKQYQSMNDTTVSGLVPRKGDSVTLTFWCRASAECTIFSYLYSDAGTGGNAKKHNEAGGTGADGYATTKVGTEWTYARHTWTYDEDAGRAPKSIVARLMGGVPNGVTVSVAGVMLVEGDTPAAWAPAEGEDIEYPKPFIEYKDAAGNLNWVGFPHWTPTDQWQRFEATCVVPSGMTITRIGFNISGAMGNMEVLNPAWSYGSPVVLASSAHTPYATQDHVSTVYATKASLKVTDDSIKAEVSARAQTDQNVADLSSRLTQTANSLTSEISDRKSAITTVTGLANAAQSTADGAAKQANLYTIGNGDAGASPKWIHLGTLTSAGDSSSATIAIVFGNGYNGHASQNSALTITIRDGWQSTQSATKACGVTAMRENCDDALVDVLAQSATVYDVWVYAPWVDSRGMYSISGQYAAWQHSGATQKAEPSTSAMQVKQDVAYRLADATKAQTMAVENQSSIKQLSNSITSEVTQRTKTDQMVSEVSSRLTQTADGFSASIDRLSDTDKKVNSWFGFGSDASGNPQLTMGSSSSPVVGVYTNTGLAYKARSGATLLELDGASRSSTMPHVHADDVSIGNWQWVPTQNGTHFTLQWIGG